MHDIVIRGGAIIDGTGRPAFTGDMAIDGTVIAAVGGKQGPGRREVDASELLVTPGKLVRHAADLSGSGLRPPVNPVAPGRGRSVQQAGPAIPRAA